MNGIDKKNALGPSLLLKQAQKFPTRGPLGLLVLGHFTNPYGITCLGLGNPEFGVSLAVAVLP